MHSLSIIILGVAAVAQASSEPHILEQRQTNWTVGQTVQTNSGPVSGHPASNDSYVSEYLGIPFARPPTGDLRFAAPVNFTGSAALNGSSFGPSCLIQQSDNSMYNVEDYLAANITFVSAEILSVLTGPMDYSEDCLYLNIWTKPQVGEAKKAVMLWVYGGGFNSGTSSIPAYNGANIVEQEDVVLVSFNYRLSILGFPGGPVGPQNLALLDQRLAIEWVRDNIANFGGDPSRIIMFGQSAGAASIDFYSYAWKEDPIAKGFITESGTAFSWGLPNEVTDSEKYWFNVTATMECGDSSANATEVLECMRAKDAQEILNAIPAASSVSSSILGYFGPTVDNTVVFSNYSDLIPAAIPLLIGNNNYEGGLFRTEFALRNVTYPEEFWTAFNLQEFTCPAGIRANASIASEIPTWRYRYFGLFPNMALSSEAGTFHIAEVPIIFDTTPSNPSSTEAEISIANYMRGAWAAFAKDPENGLSSYGEGWPIYESSDETLVRLGWENVTGINLALPEDYDGLCGFVNVSSTDSADYGDFLSAVETTATSTAMGTAAVTGTEVPSYTNTSGSSKVTRSLKSMALGVVFAVAVLLV